MMVSCKCQFFRHGCSRQSKRQSVSLERIKTRFQSALLPGIFKSEPAQRFVCWRGALAQAGQSNALNTQSATEPGERRETRVDDPFHPQITTQYSGPSAMAESPQACFKNRKTRSRRRNLTFELGAFDVQGIGSIH